MDNQPEVDEPDFGPPEAPPSKKRKVPTKLEERYRQGVTAAAQSIPAASSYVRSYMHQRAVTHVCASGTCDFVITGSADGHLKFWKRKANSIEFVKTYRAHLGPIAGMVLNSTEAQVATIGETDRALKIWSVIDFDLLYKHDIDFMPMSVAFVPNPLSQLHEHVAVSEKGSADVHIFTAIPTGVEEGPVRFLCSRHRHTEVHLMAAHPSGLFAISSDRSGAIEMWALTEAGDVIPASSVSAKGHIQFQLKSETELYCLQEAKTYATSMAVSPDGRLLALLGADGLLRMIRISTGKLYRVFDESLETQCQLQKSGKLASTLQVAKSEIEKIAAADEADLGSSIAFHPSSMLLYFTTPFGIKVLDFYHKTALALLGRNEKGLRFTKVAYSKCSEKLNRIIGLSASMRTGSEQEMEPMFVATAAKKNRFYLFTNQEGAEDSKRDVMNELPTEEEVTTMQARKQADKLASAKDETNLLKEPKRATIHTTFGDIKIILFPEECPKTVENFAVHAQQGYYNNVIFHRVIKGFMIQTGDPNGDGTGGESIWGGEFNDEFSRKLKHDRPYTLSMANAGANTNGSQFFITTVPTPFLDNKHTVFGRVENGTHVVHEIETVRTTVEDKPLKDIKILTIRVSKD